MSTFVVMQIDFSQRKFQWFILAVVTFFIYAGSLGYDFVLDDAIVTTGNRYVLKGFDGIKPIITSSYLEGFNGLPGQTYRPVPLITFAIEKAIFDLDPGTSHFINILLYLVLGWLIYLLVEILFPKLKWLPFIATGLYLWHPIHTEVVANIKSRDEILCAIGGVLGLIAWLKWTNTSEKKWKALFLVGLLISVFSKETGLMYILMGPVVIGVFKGWDKLKSTFFILSSVGILLLFFSIRFSLLETQTELQELNALNNALLMLESPVDQFFTALYYQLIYIQKLFWPTNLSWDYSFATLPLVQVMDFNFFTALIGILGFIIGLFISWKKDKRAAALMILYAALMFPTSNLLLKFGATFGERFLFSPSIPWTILIGWLFLAISDRYSDSKKAIRFVGLGVIAALIFSSYTNQQKWKNEETLFTSGIENNPQSTKTWESYAIMHRDKAKKASKETSFRKHTEISLEGFRKSIQIYPENYSALYNLGVSYLELGVNDSAYLYFEKCVVVNPAYEDGWNNLAVININARKLEQAKAQIETLLKLNPKHMNGLINKGLYFDIKQQKDSANYYYQKANQLYPNNPTVQRYL